MIFAAAFLLVFLANGPFDGQTDLSFADALLREGDYFRAVSEYKRFIFFNPEAIEADTAQIGIGTSLLFAGQYGLLSQWFEALPETSGIMPVATLLASRGAIESGAPASALVILRSCEQARQFDHLSEYSYLSGIALVGSGDYRTAAENFSLVDESSSFYSRASSYNSLLNETPIESMKNPTVAGVLGIVPGLGYAYSGHYGTAVASLVVNGALAWGTISAFQNDNNEAGWALGVLGIGFYFGNITGSAQSATRYNDYVTTQFVEEFRY